MSEKVEIIKLTSAEISTLWSTYLNVNVVNCFMTHYLETCNDPDILEILKETNHFAEKHQNEIEQLFLKEKIAIPNGFNANEHVVSNAPKLFSDVFYITSVLQMCKFGITSHTASFTLAAREDIRVLFKDLIDDVSHLYNRVVNCMQEKGIYIRLPAMNYPSKVDYINNENILTGWFGKKRPLLGIEVTHLSSNGYQNDMGKVLCTGFSQVAQDREVKDYFLRGKKLCKSISASIYEVIEESEVSTGMPWDQSITNAEVAPFSDQFMLYIIGILSALGITGYGAGISTSLRRDVGAMYANFIAKTVAFVEDGINLMIDREWMEQPPKIMEQEK
ncbi:DUF3231 family protein [Neobacillus drentensis]|uniref:DUF3231 family protein n=1 Tax=Neobacillus drentensis TaxID=220684 RepID=UPI001F27367D|nr:DUF3231 family protein [Neobacillus drentensis]ULT58755.1 DUF3231 family protein [Neobacillus drentensis]